MPIASNLHTHCTFCHGKSTIEEMTLAAIEAGFDSLGFSPHNYTGFEFDHIGVHKNRIDEYFAEIDRVQEKYRGRITLFRGFEVESRNAEGTEAYLDPRCDFNIGSVHYFNIDGVYHPVDHSYESFMKAAEAAGSIKRLWKIYFDEVSFFAGTSGYDITGHLDLICKFNEKRHIFDETDSLYQSLALDALQTAYENGKIVEVNNGGIANGNKSSCYPAPFILKRMKELNVPIILSSDSHHTSTIAQSFEETRQMLLSLGFKSQMKLTYHGFEEVSL